MHFVFTIFPPPKMVPFMRYCGKIWQSHAGDGWNYSMARKDAIFMPD